MSGVAAERHDALGAARLSIFAALFLIAVKLVAGVASGSLALVAEAAHSGTDLVAALLTFAVVRVSLRPADREHPYGHGKAEHLSALAEGGFLLVVSALIAVQAVARIFDSGDHEVDASWWLFAVLGLVVVIDVARFVALRRAAARHRSAALAASALHFASDMIGTVAVIGGLVLVSLGWQQADAVAALIVASLVVVAAARLMRENVDVLMDQAPAGVEQQVRAAVDQAEPDADVRRVRVRTAGGRHFVEVVVGYRADAGLGESHAVADEIEAAIEGVLRDCEVIVHVEPVAEEHDLRGRASAAALTVRGVREVHNVRVVDVGGEPELSLHLKLPAEIDLAAAHRIATMVEDEIADAVPELAGVHTHLEPLAPPAAAVTPDSSATESAAAEVARVVEQLTGRPPRRLDFRDGADGLTILLTIEIAGSESLESAHLLATEVEGEIRRAIPSTDEVVVHTEPVSAG